jgi:hypothetical protein
MMVLACVSVLNEVAGVITIGEFPSRLRRTTIE